MVEEMAFGGPVAGAAPKDMDKTGASSVEPKIRSNFPETWIWSDVQCG